MKFPSLRDPMGSGHDSWKVGFAFKMENIRKTVHSQPDVDSARARYGHKRQSTAPEAVGLKRVSQKVSGPTLNFAGVQDDDLHATTVQAMKSEMNDSSNPNFQTLDEEMGTTFVRRREWIKEMTPSTQDILAEYPALRRADVLQKAFFRITGVCADKALLEFVNHHGEKCFELARKRKSAREAVLEVETELSALQGDVQKYCFAI